MPRRSYLSKADYDADYDIGMESDTGHPSNRPEVRLNYHRAALFPVAQKRAMFLNDYLVGLGYPKTTVIVSVGCGYAWTAEVLESLGWTKIVPIDTSPHIELTQDNDESSEYDEAIIKVGLDPTIGEGAALKNKFILKQGGHGNRRRHSQIVRKQDMSNEQSRNVIRGIHGVPEVGISEDFVCILSDQEVSIMIQRANLTNPNMRRIHLTTEFLPNTVQDPNYNWKTIQQWKTLFPSETFISLNTWQVV